MELAAIPSKKQAITGMLSMVSSIQQMSDTILSILGVAWIYHQTWVVLPGFIPKHVFLSF
jgi:hypothetical protein